MDTLTENTVVNTKNRSHTVAAEFSVEAGKTDGVLVAQGGRFAGWSLYVLSPSCAREIGQHDLAGARPVIRATL